MKQANNCGIPIRNENTVIGFVFKAVTDHPKSWSGRISALMERCCLEQYDKRAVDRALRQLRVR